MWQKLRCIVAIIMGHSVVYKIRFDSREIGSIFISRLGEDVAVSECVFDNSGQSRKPSIYIYKHKSRLIYAIHKDV